MVMPEIPTTTPLVLVTVTEALWVSFNTCCPKATEVGDTVNPSEVPVGVPIPSSATVCVPVERLKVSEPAWVPVAVGVNVTLTVQVFPAAREVLQPVVSAKGPLITILRMVMEVVPRFESVTTWALLFLFSTCAGKVTPAGETVTLGAVLLPVPLRLTVWVPALSETVKSPVTAPETVGVKVTLMVQAKPGATLDPQLLV